MCLTRQVLSSVLYVDAILRTYEITINMHTHRETNRNQQKHLLHDVEVCSCNYQFVITHTAQFAPIGIV